MTIANSTIVTWNSIITFFIACMAGIVVPFAIVMHHDLVDIKNSVEEVKLITIENKANLANHISEGEKLYNQHEKEITALQEWRDSYKPSYISQNKSSPQN